MECQSLKQDIHGEFRLLAVSLLKRELFDEEISLDSEDIFQLFPRGWKIKNASTVLYMS